MNVNRKQAYSIKHSTPKPNTQVEAVIVNVNLCPFRDCCCLYANCISAQQTVLWWNSWWCHESWQWEPIVVERQRQDTPCFLFPVRRGKTKEREEKKKKRDYSSVSAFTNTYSCLFLSYKRLHQCDVTAINLIATCSHETICISFPLVTLSK